MRSPATACTTLLNASPAGGAAWLNSRPGSSEPPRPSTGAWLRLPRTWERVNLNRKRQRSARP
eukprot:3476639-Lingulodinium_polyedra.AAC.1